MLCLTASGHLDPGGEGREAFGLEQDLVLAFGNLERRDRGHAPWRSVHAHADAARGGDVQGQEARETLEREARDLAGVARDLERRFQGNVAGLLREHGVAPGQEQSHGAQGDLRSAAHGQAVRRGLHLHLDRAGGQQEARGQDDGHGRGQGELREAPSGRAFRGQSQRTRLPGNGPDQDLVVGHRVSSQRTRTGSAGRPAATSRMTRVSR